VSLAIYDQKPLKFLAVSAGLRIAVLSAILFVAVYTPAYASVMIDGTAAKLVVEVDDDKLPVVLDALKARFGLSVKPAPASDARVRGRFSGSMSQVIKQLLVDYDLIIKSGHDGSSPLEVILLGRSRQTSTTSPLQSRPVSSPDKFDGFK
jgi:hypothetical protein